MKYINEHYPTKRIDNIPVNYSTKIIIERNESLAEVLDAIFVFALAALVSGKHVLGTSPYERHRAECELGLLLSHNDLRKHSIVVFSFLDRLRMFFGGNRSGYRREGLYLRKIGLEIYVINYLPRGELELQLCNNIFEPVFGNPDNLLGEVRARLCG